MKINTSIKKIVSFIIKLYLITYLAFFEYPNLSVLMPAFPHNLTELYILFKIVFSEIKNIDSVLVLSNFILGCIFLIDILTLAMIIYFLYSFIKIMKNRKIYIGGIFLIIYLAIQFFTSYCGTLGRIKDLPNFIEQENNKNAIFQR